MARVDHHSRHTKTELAREREAAVAVLRRRRWRRAPLACGLPGGWRHQRAGRPADGSGGVDDGCASGSRQRRPLRQRGGRNGRRTGALKVNDHPKRVVHRVHAVRSSAVQIEDDPRSRVQLPTHPDLSHDAIGERNRRVFQLLRRPGVREIHEHARRAFEPLVIKPDFTFQLQRDAQRFRKHLAPNGTQRHGSRWRWRGRRRRARRC